MFYFLIACFADAFDYKQVFRFAEWSVTLAVLDNFAREHGTDMGNFFKIVLSRRVDVDDK
ncbi:MAG: hypothetical protein ABIO91_02325 [Pyrinomonadaceae bacterium]